MIKIWHTPHGRGSLAAVLIFIRGHFLGFSGKSFVCGPVRHVVFAVSVQKNSAEQEIKAADNDAYGATCNVHVLIWAIRVQAIVDAYLIAANEILCFEEEENETLDVKESSGNNFDPDGKQEEQECVVVLDSDAVVDPWAVMVKSLNALVADCTMSTSGGPDHFALWAEVSWVDVSQKFKERLASNRL